MEFFQKLRARWSLVPVVLGIVCLSGCHLLGSDSSVSPAEATVTAVVMTATATTGCTTGTGSPALASTMTSSQTTKSVTVGVFRSTFVTLVGTCWHPGDEVHFAAVSPGATANGNANLVPLTSANAPDDFTSPTPVAGNPPIKQTINADGTFTFKFALTSDLALYDIDNHLTLIAYTNSYKQLAATSIQVSNS